MNISSTVRFGKNWELENGKKKIGVLAFQKVVKTGNTGKTSSPKGNDRSPESNVPRLNLI